ncbi:sensor domain-containing protein [Xanthomonas populi]
MPRRPAHPGPQGGWLQRIGAMFTDVRTWSTMLYFLLMLPLGIIYFSVFTTLFVAGVGRFTAGAAVRQRGGFDPGWPGPQQRLVDVAVLHRRRAAVVRHAASGARLRQAARNVRQALAGQERRGQRALD